MSNAAVAAPETRAQETVEINKTILDDLIQATTEKERQKFVIIPKTFEEAEKYADFVAKSQLLPKGMGKNEVFLIIQVGLELGLSPMQALKGMFCVNNRVSIFGDLAVALVLRSGQLEAFDEDNAATALKQGFGRCRVKRKGSPPCRIDPAKPDVKCLDAAAQKPRECCLEHRFSLEDAKAAGLLEKDGPWKQYRGRMLQMRPRSWALRDQYADVLMGLSVYEEVLDIPAATPLTAQIVEETVRRPARKSDAARETVPTPKADPAPAPAKAETVPTPATEASHDEPTEGTDELLITKVDLVPYKDAKTGAEKKFYKLTAAGVARGFATWSDTEAATASDAMAKKTPVSIQWQLKPGKENRQIKKLAPVLPQPSESELPDEPGSNG